MYLRLNRKLCDGRTSLVVNSALDGTARIHLAIVSPTSRDPLWECLVDLAALRAEEERLLEARWCRRAADAA